MILVVPWVARNISRAPPPGALGLFGGVLLPVPHCCLVVNSPLKLTMPETELLPLTLGPFHLQPSPNWLMATLSFQGPQPDPWAQVLLAYHIFSSRRPTQLYLDICPESSRSHTVYSSPWTEPSNVSGLHHYGSLHTGRPSSAPTVSPQHSSQVLQ